MRLTALFLASLLTITCATARAEKLREVDCQWLCFDKHLDPEHLALIEKEVAGLPSKMRSRLKSELMLAALLQERNCLRVSCPVNLQFGETATNKSNSDGLTLELESTMGPTVDGFSYVEFKVQGRANDASAACKVVNEGLFPVGKTVIVSKYATRNDIAFLTITVSPAKPLKAKSRYDRSSASVSF